MLRKTIFKECIIIAAGLAIVGITKNIEYDSKVKKTTMDTTTSTIETTTEDPRKPTNMTHYQNSVVLL